MCVDLGGGQGCMSEDGTHAVEVGAAIEHGSGECVAEGVGAFASCAFVAQQA